MILTDYEKASKSSKLAGVMSQDGVAALAVCRYRVFRAFAMSVKVARNDVFDAISMAPEVLPNVSGGLGLPPINSGKND